MSELRYAIENNQLILYYHPKIDFQTNTVIGAEALVHWNHPQFGNINSEEFIPLAERTGLIRPLTHWVLKESIQQCANWHSSGINLTISVNLSMLDIVDVELPDIITGLLARFDVPPHWLNLELTESSFIADKDRCLEIMNRLADIGLHLSIDDFGIGYSSLSYLIKLPIREVKIDTSFVMSMMNNPDDATIVRATINLAHNFNLKVVAEGVADLAIYEQLLKLSCDYGQGYYFSKPKKAKDLVTWLQQSQFHV